MCSFSWCLFVVTSRARFCPRPCASTCRWATPTTRHRGPRSRSQRPLQTLQKKVEKVSPTPFLHLLVFLQCGRLGGVTKAFRLAQTPPSPWTVRCAENWNPEHCDTSLLGTLVLGVFHTFFYAPGGPACTTNIVCMLTLQHSTQATTLLEAVIFFFE